MFEMVLEVVMKLKRMIWVMIIIE